MSRTSAIILLGVLTILTPYSGLPATYRTLITVVLGATVAWVGLLTRSEEMRALRAPDETATGREVSSQASPSEMSPV